MTDPFAPPPESDVEAALRRKREAWRRYQAASERGVPQSEWEPLLREAVARENEYEDLVCKRRRGETG
ncbi:MAG: hypothetical protein QME79_14420 [Bacillota bacterium]|nr:hypothetical protein [Bacillota bacterium]